MPLLSTNFYAGGPIKAADIIQFFNLFTGVMTDQPVTFANTLTVGGSQSDASVPLRVSSQATGTARVFEARTLQADANPVFGVSRLGVLSFGAGGGTATDTTITRSGVNTLTFSGALTVTGTTMANGQLIAGGGYLQFNGANPQIVGGTATLSLRNNANNADNLLISDAGGVTVRNALTVTAGAVTVAAADGNSFRAATSTNSGGDTLIVRPFDDANSGAAQLSVVNAAGSVRNWYVTKAGAVVQANSLQVTAGNVGIGGAPSSNAGLYLPTAYSVNAAAGASYGIIAQETLVASANADSLYGAWIGPAYNVNSKTGLSFVGLSIAANADAQAGSQKYGILIGAQTGANTNNYGIYINAPSGGSGVNAGIYNLGATMLAGAAVSAPAGVLSLGNVNPALGGGAAATLGTIGGSGPVGSAQSSWLKAFIGSTAIYLPYWA